MESEKYKISGIYDLRTLEFSKSKNIKNFAFDFRPKSMNYIQQYKFFEMVEKTFNPNFNFYLIFDNEKDFVIQTFVVWIKDFCKQRNISVTNFNLVFESIHSSIFYQQFGLPYTVQLSSLDVDLNQIYKDRFDTAKLVMIEFEYNYFYKLYLSLDLEKKIASFYNNNHKIIEKNEIQICVSINRDQEILPSILEMVDCDMINLIINDTVEVCYRNIDTHKLDKKLTHFFHINSHNTVE